MRSYRDFAGLVASESTRCRRKRHRCDGASHFRPAQVQEQMLPSKLRQAWSKTQRDSCVNHDPVPREDLPRIPREIVLNKDMQVRWSSPCATCIGEMSCNGCQHVSGLLISATTTACAGYKRPLKSNGSLGSIKCYQTQLHPTASP